MIKLAQAAFLLLATILGGCSLVADTDTSFLHIPIPSEDAGPEPDCGAMALVEYGAACHDGCDNDGDDDVDCDDDDCENFCCAEYGYEYLDCNDQCDNDRDGLIDCEDTDCSGTTHCSPPILVERCRGTDNDPDCCGDPEAEPPEPNICCRNGEDDDEDGQTDCDDDDCDHSDDCCGPGVQHTDDPGNGFDTDYWTPFRLRDGEPYFDEDLDRYTAWNDGDDIGGVASLDPINLGFGLRVEFSVYITEAGVCHHPQPPTCTGYSGIALGPNEAPTEGEPPMWDVAVLVTSAHRVVLMRGGRLLYEIGLDPPPPGVEHDTTYAEVTVDLMPDTNELGENGFRMRIGVPNGRQVCHDDGSTLGCAPETEWVSDDLILYEEHNVLLSGDRGSYLMLVGHGMGVEYSDALGQTTRVSLRSCANPTAWEPGEGDDRIGVGHLCWAVGAVGSASVGQVDDDDYVMVVEGTTRDVAMSGYGINNFSLGWLETSDIADFEDWIPSVSRGPDMLQRYFPINTSDDLNCMNLAFESFPAVCQDHLPDPFIGVATDSECASARSHRSPHVIASADPFRVLYSEAVEPGLKLYDIAVATYGGHTDTTWTRQPDEHRLTLDMVLHQTGSAYRSLRDPVAVCLRDEDGECTRDYIVLVIGEPDITATTDGDADADADGDADGSDAGLPDAGWTGDDIIYAEYTTAGGFRDVSITLDSDNAGNPLAGRELAEPWLLWDPSTSQYLLWVTSNVPMEPTQIDLLLATPSGTHPLAEPTWELFSGSPVFTIRDLELLHPRGHYLHADCSVGCQIGGLTGIVAPDPITSRNTLHAWINVIEMHDSDELPTHHVRHLVQPFGLP